MAFLSAMFGVRFVTVLGSSGGPSQRARPFPKSKPALYFRSLIRLPIGSYELMTGSVITSIVNGHWKDSRLSSLSKFSTDSDSVPRLTSSSSGINSTSSGRRVRRAPRHLSAILCNLSHDTHLLVLVPACSFIEVCSVGACWECLESSC
jgi:hypothetical protein